MLDVHLPHKPLHGLREFFIHLFTITVGLLIATQIESFVEWRHHVHLAEEARESLRAEIEKNLTNLQAAQPELKQRQAEVNADLEAMRRIQDHPNDPKAQNPTLKIYFHTVPFSDTAWKTAQATGALGYMPYEEAEKYAGIYQAQFALVGMQEKPMEDVAALMGLLYKFGLIGDESKKISVDQANALAEKFGQLQTHLLTGDLLVQESIEYSQAFLENRKARVYFSGSIK